MSTVSSDKRLVTGLYARWTHSKFLKHRLGLSSLARKYLLTQLCDSNVYGKVRVLFETLARSSNNLESEIVFYPKASSCNDCVEGVHLRFIHCDIIVPLDTVGVSECCERSRYTSVMVM